MVANIYIEAGITDKETRQKQWAVLNDLISLYSQLGDKYEMQRLRQLQKARLKRLVKLGELEEAEVLLKGWESSGNVFDSGSQIFSSSSIGKN